MNQFLSNLASIKSNPHVSWPVVGAAALQVAKIWFPAHAAQIDDTTKVLVLYGILAAGNSAPTPPKDNP